MLCLDNLTKVTTDSSSKGNQCKFYYNGYWIKLDNPECHEGLAEDFVSKFCATILDFPYVQYESAQYEYMERVCAGCQSYNMYGRPDVSFVSFRSLFKQWGIPLNMFYGLPSVEQNILNVVKICKERIGLNLLDYFRRLLFLDCLIINEDRHLMNIGVCYCQTDGKFYEAPCFDNGSSLFCVNWTYRKRKTFAENLESAKSIARPFSKFYDKQAEALLNIGCQPLKLNKSCVDALLGSYINPLYSEELNHRVRAVLWNRLEYYRDKVFVFV